jgi:NADH:ubiquinone oxidoreductase subunit K
VDEEAYGGAVDMTETKVLRLLSIGLMILGLGVSFVVAHNLPDLARILVGWILSISAGAIGFACLMHVNKSEENIQNYCDIEDDDT